MDFDAVLERFPENKMTPDAYFMKGMALKQNNHRDDAASEFRTLSKSIRVRIVRFRPRNNFAPWG